MNATAAPFWGLFRFHPGFLISANMAEKAWILAERKIVAAVDRVFALYSPISAQLHESRP